jgi:hypothetical protein
VEVDAPVAGPSAGSPQQKGKTSATNSTETLGIFRVSSRGDMTKTRGLLPEAEEDVRLQKRQRKLQPVIQKRQINHPQELQKVLGRFGCVTVTIIHVDKSKDNGFRYRCTASASTHESSGFPKSRHGLGILQDKGIKQKSVYRR